MVFGGLATLVVVNPRIANEWIPLNIIAATAYVVFRMRRYIRRVRNRNPLPAAIARYVTATPHFARLDAAEQSRLLLHTSWFLNEQRINGVGVEADDQIRANVAMGAALLSLGLPHFEWSQDREILVYADAFNDGEFRARSDGELDGQFHPQGPILFSAKEVRDAFQEEDGSNVVLHEFAHAIDFAGGGDTDGTPDSLDAGAVRDWRREMQKHLASFGSNRRLYRLLDNYAYTEPAEFFAACTEAFFELPDVLNEVAPELYTLLRRLYRQDPLSRIPEPERTTYAQVMGRTTRAAKVVPASVETDTDAVDCGDPPAAVSNDDHPAQPELAGVFVSAKPARVVDAPAELAPPVDDAEGIASDGLDATTGAQLVLPGMAKR